MYQEYKLLSDHIQKRVQLSEEELNTFLKAFTVKKVKKRQFIVQPDFITNHRNFVKKGAMRAYVINEDGHDYTIQFAVEDWWITDYSSYIYQKPATMFVIAIENSELLQIDYVTEQQLKQVNPKYETFFRIMGERSTAYMQRRVIENITMNATKRYERFLEKYPQIEQRFPQYTIASYLGVTTEFLSRLRKKRVRIKT